MDNTANTISSEKGKNSDRESPRQDSSNKPLTDEQYSKVRQMISNKSERDPKFKQELEQIHRFNNEMSAHSEKMEGVLEEQESKILRLHSIASHHDVKFIQEYGGLELSVPSKMSNELAEKLSKEVGAIDRSLQNKFSEYENLSRKDIRLYDSLSTSVYKEIYSNNKKMYKELFESENKE
jgi:hypothetical protein